MVVSKEYVDRVHLDLDGVLVNFMGPALKCHGFEEDEVYSRPEMKGVWMAGRSLGITDEAFYKPLSCAEFWFNLPWMADGFDILKLIERAFGRENICITTSPIDDGSCLDGKYRWMKKYLPDYVRNRRFQIVGGKFWSAHPKALLVDDSDTNCESWVSIGGAMPAIVVPRPWNHLHYLEEHISAAEYVAAQILNRFGVDPHEPGERRPGTPAPAPAAEGPPQPGPEGDPGGRAGQG